MAKTRVYELARDLNLTNQILLSKLSDLEIYVKSNMSSLDDEAVAKVKTVIFGKKEVSIEETSIKPTVIRRRRKKVPVEVVNENIAPINNSQPEKLIKTSERIERFRKKYEKFKTKHATGESHSDRKTSADLSSQEASDFNDTVDTFYVENFLNGQHSAYIKYCHKCKNPHGVNSNFSECIPDPPYGYKCIFCDHSLRTHPLFGEGKVQDLGRR